MDLGVERFGPVEVSQASGTSEAVAAPWRDAGSRSRARRVLQLLHAGQRPLSEAGLHAFEHGDKRIFWKIDYYDKWTELGSQDPANAEITNRVLTLMLAEDY